MSLGPASLQLAAARSIVPFVPEVPRDVVDLEDRSRKMDGLLDFLRFGNRDVEEIDARQVGGFDLAQLLAAQLQPTPREPAGLEERTRPMDFLSSFLRFGNRETEEVDARQVGSFDLEKLLTEQLKPTPASAPVPSTVPTPAHTTREASDLEERSRKMDGLLKFLGFGRRDIEDIDARQLGSFNLPHLVSSSLSGRQVGSFDLSGLVASQLPREAKPDPAESSSKTLKLNRELARELEEEADHVARMIGRGLEHTLD
ncbi:hypothetical protein DL96DRAFT_1710667 [Flagelloscypha sp. PMI_526]|nr:hypothetical protein DL96DRAFT_1710667 [Flagelloscypha sp. PMI_526]